MSEVDPRDAEIAALKAKVKDYQEKLSKVGQPREKKSQKEVRAEAKAKADAAAAGGGGGKGDGSATATKEGGDAPKRRGSEGPGGGDKKERSMSAGEDGKEKKKKDAVSSSGAATGGGGSGGGERRDKRSNRFGFFDHLPPMKPVDFSQVRPADTSLHPVIIHLGHSYRSGLIREDDDRVGALLMAFVEVVKDYTTPENKSLIWDLDKHIRSQVQFLIDCRPHCVGMGNVIKHLRYVVSQTSHELSDHEAKEHILEKMAAFYEDRYLFARTSIGNLLGTVVQDKDVILTFGSSPLMRDTLLEAAKHKKFRVIVVDSRPLNDGMITIKALSPTLQCVYTPLSGASRLMKEATRVILGASSMLSNGSMLAPMGSAIIASLARSANVPVIALCESYKFSERVQLDSIVFNELGNVREIALPHGFDGGPAVPQLRNDYLGNAQVDREMPFAVLNPRYDCTPIDNISAVATETGLIPPTSVPVLIRELRSDIQG